MGRYRQMVADVREALRLAGLSEVMIAYNLINLPALSKLLPEEVLAFYTEVKTMTVLYFDQLGFSASEIVRRIGGNSRVIVAEILREYKKNNDSVTN